MMGAMHSGLYFTCCLLLIPFRRRLTTFIERDSPKQPAGESPQETG